MKVPKIIFFHAFGKKNPIFCVHLFSLKIRLQIILNKVWDIKKKPFWLWKQSFSKSQKWHFSKGVNPCFWSKNAISFFLSFLVKKRLGIMLNKVWDSKESFSDYKNKKL